MQVIFFLFLGVYCDGETTTTTTSSTESTTSPPTTTASTTTTSTASTKKSSTSTKNTQSTQSTKKDLTCRSCDPTDKEAMKAYYDLYQAGLDKDREDRECSGEARGTIYYGTISYSCYCLVKEHVRFENPPDYRPDSNLHQCLLIEYHAPDIGAPQTWAVSTLFLTIVIGALYLLLFLHDVKPTTVQPYNYGVLVIFGLLGCIFIISCCGMSPNINYNHSWPTAFANVSFTLFLLTVSGFLVYGLVTESRAQMYSRTA